MALFSKELKDRFWRELRFNVMDVIVWAFGRWARYRLTGKCLLPDNCDVTVERSAFDGIMFALQNTRVFGPSQYVYWRHRPNHAMRPLNLAAALCSWSFYRACGDGVGVPYRREREPTPPPYDPARAHILYDHPTSRAVH